MNIEKFARTYRVHTRLDSGDQTVIIPGKLGHIYEYDVDENVFGVIIMPNPPRKLHWGFTKRTLLEYGFTIVQDGDGEGAAIFDPDNETQAKLAIRAARIKHIRKLSPEESKRRSERAKALSRKPSKSPKPVAAD